MTYGVSFITETSYLFPLFVALQCLTVPVALCTKDDTRDFTFDSKFEAARALGGTTLALGLCVWIFYILAGCCRFGPLAFRIVGFFCFCCCLFQGLVFLVNQSVVCAVECGLDTGGNCGIAATVLWFFATIMSCAAGKRPEDEGAAKESGEADEEQ